MSDSVRKAVGFSGAGIGLFAVVAPSAFVATYGLPATPATKIMTRLFGCRGLALGAMGLAITAPDARRTVTTVATAMGVADAACIATAGDVAASARVRGLLTVAGFLAANCYLLAND